MKLLNSLLFAVLLCFLPACDSHKAEIQSAQAQLELAKTKADLDGMFLALKSLQSYGVKNLEGEIEQVKNGIDSVQAIRLKAKEGKNHAVVTEAEGFLKIFPKHEEILGLLATTKKALDDQNRQLENMRANNELDGLSFLLKQIESCGEITAAQKTELENVESGTKLLKEIKILKGEHNHEEIVNKTAQLLDLFPDHPDARRDFKESGLIFYYLKSSLAHMRKCFEAGENGDFHLVNNKSDPKELCDWDTITHNLNKANDAVAEAIKLDPQYEVAYKLRDRIQDSQNSISMSVSGIMFVWVDALQHSMLAFYDKAESAMTTSLGIEGDSPTRTWAKYFAPLAEKSDETIKPIMERIQRYASVVVQLQNKDNETVAKTAKEAAVLTDELRKAVLFPSGNLQDYKKDVHKVANDFSNLVSNYKSNAPNVSQTAESLSGFGKTFTEMKVLQNPVKTEKALEKYKGLLSI